MTGSGQRFPQGHILRGCFVYTQEIAGDTGENRRLAVMVNWFGRSEYHGGRDHEHQFYS